MAVNLPAKTVTGCKKCIAACSDMRDIAMRLPPSLVDREALVRRADELEADARLILSGPNPGEYQQ